MDQDKSVDVEKRRSRGGVADIGTPEEGAIKETININDRILFVKERAVYELVLADTLDPKREKPTLPPSVHTLLLNRGSEDPLVARTFLTARVLFQKEYYLTRVDVNKGLRQMLDVLQELIAMDEEVKDYLVEHDRASQQYEQGRGNVPGYMLPSIPDMQTRCKTIFQKADHASQGLMDVIRIFYPDFVQGYYTPFVKFIVDKYGESDPFTTFLKQVVPFIIDVRNIRNCLDHRKKELVLTGFEIQGNSSVLAPTIEMDDNGRKIPRQDLASFLRSVLDSLVTVIETMLPYLSNKHIQPMGFTPQIRIIPEEQRRNHLIKYGIWLPLGEGGFYKQ